MAKKRQRHAVPETLQTNIIQRFLREDNFKGFLEDYKSNSYRRSMIRDATPTDRKILKDFRENGLMLGELAEKYNTSTQRVRTSIVIAARVM